VVVVAAFPQVAAAPLVAAAAAVAVAVVAAAEQPRCTPAASPD